MINIIQIKDLDAPELQIYYNLNEAQLFHYFEPKPGIFIAESPKVIERALDAGCVPMSFLMEKKHVETQAKEILVRCDKLQSRDLTQESLVYREDEHVIPVYVAEVEMLAKITGYQLTRGMLCAMYRPALPSVEQLCKNARRVAILENVVNNTASEAPEKNVKTGSEKIDFSKVKVEPLFEEFVDFDTFSKSDFRAVKVKECVAVPKSKKLLQFTLDDGTGTDRTILSGIHSFYEPEELVGKTLIAITNLPPRAMMGIDSCGMLLSAIHEEEGEEKLHLFMVDNHIPAGAKLY